MSRHEELALIFLGQLCAIAGPASVIAASKAARMAVNL